MKLDDFDHDVACMVRGERRKIEGKRRKRAFATIDQMLGENHFLAIRDDRCRPMIVMDLKTFAELAADAASCRVRSPRGS